MSTRTLDKLAGTSCLEAGIDFLASGAQPHGAKTVFVLLHGIGSGAASWHYQLAALKDQEQVCALAWNAPGYANSLPLNIENPCARDYANALWRWLDAIKIQGPIVLVGHSLGALIAASATLLRPAAIQRLVLLAPALGYGDDSQDAQEKVIAQRIGNLRQLGAPAMAALRASAMLSANADQKLVQFVEKVMSQLNPAGYEQAVRMLSTGRLIADLTELLSTPHSFDITVACGSADSITPPQKCSLAATAASTELLDLGAVGHVCALEGHRAVNQLLGIV
jgi:pimeloyl-ACP methyl ester carboxylesterase